MSKDVELILLFGLAILYGLRSICTMRNGSDGRRRGTLLRYCPERMHR